MDDLNLVLLFLGIAAVVALLCLGLPRPPDIEKARFWAQLFGGAAVICAFAWAFVKDTRTFDRTRVQSATDLYVRSAELMANGDSVATRTAGVFALGSVTTNAEYQLAVRDTLAAFVRSQRSNIEATRSNAPLRQDVQAALDVLGRRDASVDQAALDLRDCYLTRPTFFATRGFSRAMFFDSVLFGPDFRNADLRYALMDHARMGDYLAVAAYGDGAWDDIINSSDWEQWMKYNFIANFEGARLIGARLVGAVLTGAIFAGADVRDTDFSLANLSRADFRNAKNVDKAIFATGTARTACADDLPLFSPGAGIVLPRCPR